MCTSQQGVRRSKCAGPQALTWKSDPSDPETMTARDDCKDTTVQHIATARQPKACSMQRCHCALLPSFQLPALTIPLLRIPRKCLPLLLESPRQKLAKKPPSCCPREAPWSPTATRTRRSPCSLPKEWKGAKRKTQKWNFRHISRHHTKEYNRIEGCSMSSQEAHYRGRGLRTWSELPKLDYPIESSR